MAAPTLLVIADDLTGANDAGVQFAAAGIRGVVLADPHVDALPGGYGVVVVNTESRHLPKAEAAKRVWRIARLGVTAGVKYFYKKTDSTLRGNVGAELEALLDATEKSFLPFVPALPDLDRTTVQGKHFVQGVPISETAFARDPLNPIEQSSIVAVLAAQSKLSLSSVAADELEKVGLGIAIVDCSCNGDLARIAEVLAANNRLYVLSGSVALAKHIVPYLHFDTPPPALAKPQAPILFVNGSLNERAFEQIACGTPHYSKLRLTPEQLINGRADITIPAGGGHLLLYSAGEPSDLQAFCDLAWSRAVSEKELHLRVAERTGRIVHEILAAGVYRTLVVFGGDTLAGIARANHWRAFVPLTEMEPGISVSVPAGSDLTLVTKAGGFGDKEVIGRIVAFVMQA